MDKTAPTTITRHVERCANDNCPNVFETTEQAMRSNRPSDFLPHGWHPVFATQSLEHAGYVCSLPCAMAYATQQHVRGAIATRNGDAYRA